MPIPSIRINAAPTPVVGDLHYESESFKKLPGPFGNVTGSLVLCKNPNLLTLTGSPGSVGKDVAIFSNPKLASLIDGPHTVGGGYRCSNNGSLKSLAGSPQLIPGSYNCATNPGITSLVGGPTQVGTSLGSRSLFKASHCCNLRSLEGLSREIGGGLMLDNLESLNDITDIWRHCKRLGGVIDLTNTVIERGGIGILMIKGVSGIVSEQVALKIISRYLGTGSSGVMRCRKELITQGFPDHAEL